jgi:hypothetical protein
VTMPPDLKAAHKHSSKHRSEVLASQSCGCFHCRAVFPPSEITRWVDEDSTGVGQTAMCPRCHIDAVIGSASGLTLDGAFLKRMHTHWFG